MNPNKEARIQQLETQISHSSERINQLERRVESLEKSNKELMSKLVTISNR